MSEIGKEVRGIKKYTLEEWREKGKELFGEKVREWKFKCPACGKVTSVKEFVEAGLSEEKACNAAYQECIGRYTGAGGPKEGQQPCNWAAYGLFGTLWKGVMITAGDGKEIEAFDFAEDE